MWCTASRWCFLKEARWVESSIVTENASCTSKRSVRYNRVSARVLLRSFDSQRVTISLRVHRYYSRYVRRNAIYPTICLRYVLRGRGISARVEETTRGPGSWGESSIAEAVAGARNRVEIACAFAPRIRWLVKRLKDRPPPRCFHVKYLLCALLFFPYFSLVSLSILYRVETYESLIARSSYKAISLSRCSRHNSESGGSKITFSSDVKYLFQRLPFVG